MMSAMRVEEHREIPPSAKMGINVITHSDIPTPRTVSEDFNDSSLLKLPGHPHTPPESISGSPHIKPETTHFIDSFGYSRLPRIAIPCTPNSSPVRLPSLEEFDQGVEALAKAHGRTLPWTPPSPLSSPCRSAMYSRPLLPVQSYTQEVYTPYTVSDSFMHGELESYPSPPPDAENRHINQKYTTEEGDFIIYAWHDKKLKWQRIKQDFATMFGRTPERTVQGLQAWYYRMNQRIPVWDKDGWLIFESEEDLEPKHVSIKCRERDGQDKPMEPLGLAQRYPERAIHYSWVDSELKHKARDWASKRSMQYRDRRERRRRKEQRRLKL